MKLLNGLELVGYIKERQAKQVRALRQADHVLPKLAIIQTVDTPVINTYVGLKRQYGEDILVDVDVHQPAAGEVLSLIEQLNTDETVHGMIVQLPLADGLDVQSVLDAVAPHKDVDGLGAGALYDPATPLAINWLLAGYNIDLRQKKVLIIGNGRLVGAPLARMWQNSGYDVQVVDETIDDLAAVTLESDVIVTATGVPGLLKSDMIRPDTVVIDAGTASEHGKIVGDVADDVRERQDLAITPVKGGVGPLTVTALFDNLLRAARATATQG